MPRFHSELSFLLPLVLLACEGSGALSAEQWRVRLARAPSPTAPELCKPAKRSLPRPIEGHPSPCVQTGVELAQGLTSVSYLMVPGNGMASRTVERDGYVHGDHMSGSPVAPSITEEGGCVAPACVAALWQLGIEVREELRQARLQSDPPSSNYQKLSICEKTDCVHFTWGSGKAIPSARVEAITTLMSAMEVGYW